MSEELIVHFDTPAQFKIRYQDDETELLPFESPIKDAEYQEIRWYLEDYSTDYTSDPDDTRAQHVEKQLPIWGELLFKAIFTNPAHRFFSRLQDSEENERYITLSSVLPEILSLPWEVLKDPHGAYLCHENPRIAIRRSLKTKSGGRPPHKVKTKTSLRILFIVSRPEGAGFIDPRAEAQAILHLLKNHEIQQIELEFLPQATLKVLLERLENNQLPAVDIVHFDGHGAFDSHGALDSRAISSEVSKEGNTAIKNMGYLLFETEEGKQDFVSAEKLGELLHRQKVSMMVLSACQSAKVAGEDAMGSVAARLVYAGIPAVLAMTHSVLVKTTELLFKQFYQEVAKGRHLGVAVENARRELYRETKRHIKRFGEREVVVKLQDWFIASLYQIGQDIPLLKPATESTVSPPALSYKLPALQEVGFFGRARELWDIECWLRTARRVTITGFGGQGKTYLVAELARWLLQKQRFESVVFVNYRDFQSEEVKEIAISMMGEVWGKTLLDDDAARTELKRRRTLLILDNVESLKPAKLYELFDVAAQWSEIGATRVLVTTRPDIAVHPQFPHAGSHQHRVLHLEGLLADDAVNYLQHLLALPPAHKLRATYNETTRLLRVVKNHPLSIPSINQALRTQRWETVETQLHELMVANNNDPVVASLQLSLTRLDAEVVAWLPKLGVFQGGALDRMLSLVTELPEEQLSKLLNALITTGLIHPHPIPETENIYFEFHPTLAPVLWTRLTEAQQQELRQRYQQHYYQLSRYFYFEDDRNPVLTRTLVKLELSNLLAAVKGALQAGSAEAVKFVDNVNRFLGYFGLTRDRAVLTQQAQQLAGEVGSDNWYLSHSNQAAQFFDAGRYAEAAEVCQQLLTLLPPGAKRCSILGYLGRCLNQQGQAEAVACYQQELTELAQLEQDDWAIREKSVVYTDLADALTNMGQFDAAKQAYLQGLDVAEKLKDQRQIAAVNGQLGTLALLQGELAEAEQRHQAALAIFEQLNEPSHQATAWHQLGMVYQEAKQWEAAETAYRRAAHLKETQGRLQSAASTWNQLAMVAEEQGKWTEAEQWYRKAVAGFKTAGDSKNYATGLNNLANLLQQDSARLSEARDLATQALAIRKTLDPAAAEIWKSYNILAKITAQQGDLAAAGAYRRLSREAKLNYAGTRYELEQFEPLISMVIAAVTDAAVRQELETLLDSLPENNKNFVQAIRQILAGERDVEVLCEPLGYWEAPVVVAILERGFIGLR